MKIFDEAIQESIQAGKDAFERALMNSDICDAFSQALEDAFERAKLNCFEREISFASERIAKKLSSLRHQFEDEVQDIMYAKFDSILSEFCEQLDDLSENLIEKFNRE